MDGLLEGERFGNPVGKVRLRDAVLTGFSGGGEGGHGVDEGVDEGVKEVVLTGDSGGYPSTSTAAVEAVMMAPPFIEDVEYFRIGDRSTLGLNAAAAAGEEKEEDEEEKEGFRLRVSEAEMVDEVDSFRVEDSNELPRSFFSSISNF